MSTIARIAALLAFGLATAAQAFIVPIPEYMYEYTNRYTGHYVLLDQGEAAIVSSGVAGPGWDPTGYQFEIVTFSNTAFYPTQKPVCRFYSPVNNSHFFTANPAECESLKDPASGWLYEKIAFTAMAAQTPCPATTQPIYRVYNGRAAQHDVNHRFTPDVAVRDEMLAAGWIDEGIAFCTASSAHLPMKSLQVDAKTIQPLADCQSRVGSCVALGQLAAMPNHIFNFLPPSFVTQNPLYPQGAQAITGSPVDVNTNQSPQDSGAVLAHSFVQIYGSPDSPFFGASPYGLHIASTDRLAGPYASISPMYELAGAAPPPGGVDPRLYPWAGPRHHIIDVSFPLTVPTAKKSSNAGDVYGGLLLQFGDASTGRSFYAQVQAYGTVSYGDFATRDANVGIPLVATTFRPNPSFGQVLDGAFASCDGKTACIADIRNFRFRLTDTDFAKLLANARSIDPALSTDPANYFVAQFRVYNETFGDAELGATVNSVLLEEWY